MAMHKAKGDFSMVINVFKIKDENKNRNCTEFDIIMFKIENLISS